MKEGVTRAEMAEVRYGLMQFVNDKNLFIEDKFGVEDTFKMMGAPTKAFGYFVSLMILCLSFFMMTVSVGQKMRDLTWESGVLRSIGLSAEQNNKIFFYEVACIVGGSFIAGVAGGLFSTMLLTALFSEIVELARTTIIPYYEMAFIIVIIVGATYIAVRLPARQMNKKQISSVLKGVGS